MKIPILVLAVLSFAPISTLAKDPEIIEISPDTYMITGTSRAGSIFANMSKLKTKVLKRAQEFAESQGKVIIPISDRTERPIPGFPLYEYQFRLVDPDSPDAKSTGIESSPDHIQETRNEYSGGLTIRHEDNNEPDLYTELMKLDDLRQKGILTDEEFAAQKKKLLEAN